MNALTTATPIVLTEGSRVFATSRDVAAYFEKEVKHVHEAIRSLIRQGVPNFRPCEINDLTGTSIHHYKMDRDGFTLLAMGFTGPKALKFKLAYIAAFNEALERLKELETTTPAIPRDYASALRLAADNYEAKLIAEEGKAKAEAALEEAQPLITLGELVERHLRTVSEVARTLAGVNSMRIKSDLVKAGYLYRRGGPKGQYRVRSQYRDEVFVEAPDGFGQVAIFAAERGHRVIATLFEQGRLTMRARR